MDKVIDDNAKLNFCNSDLAHFTCTTQYYSNGIYKFVYTDGIKYLAKNAECYWLLDDISIFQTDPKIKHNKHLQAMQFWTLKVNEDHSACLLCEQDTDIRVFEKHYEYTSFPLPKISLWLWNMFQFWESAGTKRGTRTDNYGCLILPSEY